MRSVPFPSGRGLADVSGQKFPRFHQFPNFLDLRPEYTLVVDQQFKAVISGGVVAGGYHNSGWKGVRAAGKIERRRRNFSEEGDVGSTFSQACRQAFAKKRGGGAVVVAD